LTKRHEARLETKGRELADKHEADVKSAVGREWVSGSERK
jgi:hypothetical protein